MFKERVLKVVRAIPKGKTLSYGEVAVLAGSLRAYRAVGTILKGNHDPKIPCHRVIKSDGSVGNYNGGTWRKRKLLIQEGSI
ncbi:6-O-methylguanine DNA methyltransferase [Candidatus Kaiserbacteria bacterium RIFCSPHIGHO2_02_FULL_49_11]|uniref:6-O-methylguanine DNA methyltransferase n=1 Tax=Candidatus Kaiserbacteria bacterium RIFCSPHIGHO2_02_FULL_49_11 TaxID=1798489 RepID=A0A1F6D1T3_9BACT|nr:MAG: 6-O-methylguanine DNA methyltransferase [Candidatus Kaiserbacteria bacterium RIFCSPHIGHO2_02_FULL_49_11]